MASEKKQRTYGGIAVEDRRDHRRTLLIDAGLAVFSAEGFGKTSVSSICSHAKLARAHFYQEFADREELLVAVYERVQTQGRAAVVEALAGLDGADMETVARAAFTAYIGYVGEDRRRAAISFVAVVGVSEAMEKRRLADRKVWRDLIQAQMTRSLGPDYQPRGGWAVATTGVVGALSAMMEQWTQSKRFGRPEDFCDVLVQFVLALV
ncbi:putative TetR family transcriptional regulator [Gordonia effusa NBRC 100432]|uniref:Putative TetR family transcriptional regulator n=1 Tax=Gordonia effusa NBRC 100432 TaxID=1077974 RepID=H0QVI7_9ACTN|nr:TetR/AcrR family transcriptional regulator [Gordonia effusa]GAB16864.1 putative TetR family transcriptional regulator [Gordonia effusa NBRC 100432]